ncbi:MAG: hypothetical protein JO180_08100, partial [Gemmatirosa sp.]|nr:hypothetical protein [Gemmatirosa sp.]
DRYAGWLTALEARRDATPAHVFDRVWRDYEERLRGVRDQLTGHVAPLREEESALARRQDEMLRTLSERQDELAEVELRMLVGEYSAEDGERRVQETAAVVRELDGQRRGVSEQLGGIRALLAQAAAPTAEPAPAPAAPVAPPGPQSDDDGDEAARAADEPAAHPAPVAPTAPSAWGSAAGRDESIVGTGDRLDSLAASLGGTVAQPPVAVGAGAGREKTLRCQACGEMNYPTEWYCEQCGGELAAL